MADAPIICEQTGRPIAPHETAFVVDGRVVCREAHDVLRPACPYCHVELAVKPAPYAKCPECGQTIYIRTSQDIFDTTLLTREQAEAVDRIDDLVRPLRPFGIGMRDFIATRDKLAQDTAAAPADDDVLWQLYLEAARRNPQPDQQAQVLLMQARFLHAQGKDHRTVHRAWGKAALAALRHAGAGAVRIVGLPQECVASRRLDGCVLTLADAREQQPLPCADCNRKPVVAEMTSRAATPPPTNPHTARGLHARQTLGRLPFCDCHYEPADTSTAPADGCSPTPASQTSPAKPDSPRPTADPGLDLLDNLDI